MTKITAIIPQMHNVVHSLNYTDESFIFYVISLTHLLNFLAEPSKMYLSPWKLVSFVNSDTLDVPTILKPDKLPVSNLLRRYLN